MRNLVVLLVVGGLASCSSMPKKDEERIESAQEYYREGLRYLKEAQYKTAAESFDKVLFQHPGDPITPYAELMSAYSLFLDRQFADAVDVLDFFIKLHPAHQDVAYAYYLKALCSYMQISEVDCDQEMTHKAFYALMDVINRFPGTPYAKSCQLKVTLVNDQLAGQEMNVGRFYLKKQNPIAAINRFDEVLRRYDTTVYAPEALYRSMEGYAMLGLHKEVKAYAQVLSHNHPQNAWNQKAQELLMKLGRVDK